MKTFNNNIKLVSAIFIFCIGVFCLPQTSTAQRFGHVGGGGGSRGGGGGGHMAQPSGGGRGGFNGGARVEAPRVFRPAAPRMDRGGGGVIHNEGVSHHVYGGVRPYAYHPYHPYGWGPYWHPFGYFAGALAADAFLFSIANQQYYYDNGVYYEPSGSGYVVVPPPIGAVVSYLPAGYITVQVGDDIYYYYGGAFYISQGGSFRVVPAPVGAIVTEIPEGATDQVINGVDYLLFNNTYYQPISQNGQDAYEVVQVN